ALQCEVVGKVDRRRAFARPSLEVHQLPDLKLFALHPAWQVVTLLPGGSLKNLARLQYLLTGVVAASSTVGCWFWQNAVCMNFPHELPGNIQQFRNLWGRELAKCLGVVWSERSKEMLPDRGVQ